MRGLIGTILMKGISATRITNLRLFFDLEILLLGIYVKETSEVSQNYVFYK